MASKTSTFLILILLFLCSFSSGKNFSTSQKLLITIALEKHNLPLSFLPLQQSLRTSILRWILITLLTRYSKVQQIHGETGECLPFHLWKLFTFLQRLYKYQCFYFVKNDSDEFDIFQESGLDEDFFTVSKNWKLWKLYHVLCWLSYSNLFFHEGWIPNEDEEAFDGWQTRLWWSCS